MQNDPIKELESRIKATFAKLPRRVGDAAVNFALDNWKRQGFLGATFQPWLPRKRETSKTRGRQILTGPGAKLRRSFGVMRTEPGRAVVGSERPYARAHNEGFRGVVTVPEHTRQHFKKEKLGTGKLTKTGKERTKTVSRLTHESKVKGFQRRMNLPRRQFIGESPYLTASITRIIAADILKAAKA